MKSALLVALMAFGILTLAIGGCDDLKTAPQQPSSASGVHKAGVQLTTGADGLTVEQRNVSERLKRDNEAGSIKHLYVLSPMSGQVILYSTVRGKVTSSHKRLTPGQIVTGGSTGQYGDRVRGFGVDIGDQTRETPEVLGDDGTYGDSGDYIYWFDSKGIYHQHYRGNEILHISSSPIAFKSIIMNMETNQAGE